MNFVATLTQVAKWRSLPAEELRSMAPVRSDSAEAVPVDIVIRRLPSDDRSVVLAEQGVWILRAEELCRQARHRSGIAPASSWSLRAT